MKAKLSARPRLSICITTLNRANVISSTLNSIAAQIDESIELVIVNGASTDNTAEVLRQFSQVCPSVRVFHENVNSGIDADFDKAIGYASGEYCWLMTDDDLLKPGAISKILKETDSQPDLIVVDATVYNQDFSKLLIPSRMGLSSDRVFESANDEFLSLAGDALSFIGGVVIRREVWLSRERELYYGTLFVHVGVIFQLPALQNIRVLAEPLIEIRYGSAMWTPRTFEIWMFKWPDLVWGFSGFSDTAKASVCEREPWRRKMDLLKHRAKGNYSPEIYNVFLKDRVKGLEKILAGLIARVPGKLANFVAVALIVTIGRNSRMGLNDLLGGPSAGAASHWLAKVLPLSRVDE